MSATYLFVYGTLRRDGGHVMHDVVARGGELRGIGTVLGELFSLGEYPGMVCRPATTTVVVGEVYELHPDCVEDVLAELDEYEGLGGSGEHALEFARELTMVTLTDGSRIGAWTYVLDGSTEGLERIESGDFVAWRRSTGRRATSISGEG